MTPDKFVAHRGSPRQFPENTLIGIEQAVHVGAKWIEFDVQFTQDFVPVLYHDETLMRMSAVEGSILETPLSDVRDLIASNPERFGDKYDSIRVSTLEELFEQLPDWPDVKFFLEIKTESLEHFGRQRVVDCLIELIDKHSVVNQLAAIISKDEKATACVRDRRETIKIGWVVPDLNRESLDQAAQLLPEYVFADQNRMQDWLNAFPNASWQNVVYTVNDFKDAAAWFDQGVDMVETDVFDLMLNQTE